MAVYVAFRYRGLAMRSLAVALLFTLPALAADPPSLDEQIKKAELTEAEAKALKGHGFVVGGREYKQVFTPYIGGGPVFVTSDSLLNAFHVLFEESVYRLELANARKLPAILADIEKQLPAAEKALAGDAELMKKAAPRARVFLGVARMLLDPKAGPDDEQARLFSAAVRALLDARAGRAPLDSKAVADDEAVRKLVEAEVKRVTAAKGTEKPAWLGKADNGFVAIDYTRFQPRGFYTRSPQLERYFRTLNWLQAIPWRLDNDDEFAAILLLAKAYKEASKPKDWIGNGYWDIFAHFLGEGDAWDLPKAARYLPDQLTANGVNVSRATAKKREANVPQSAINDQLRFQPDKSEAQFRFISAYRLPDTVLLQRTASEKRMPSGLDVAAALGSSFARGRLKKDAAEVLKTVDESAGLLPRPNGKDGRSVYVDYLNCLRVLLEESEPDAPKLFKSDAWTAKTCQSALSGWAQMRHTWVLQAKQTVRTLGKDLDYPGFVEPVPEFYARFAELVERSEKLFDTAGAFDPALRPTRTVGEIRAIWTAIDTAKTQGLAALTAAERKTLTELIPDLPATGDPSKDEKLAEVLGHGTAEIFEWLTSALRNSGRTWSDPIVDSDMATDPAPDPKYCWPELKELCKKLEPLARKQLRGAEFSKDDRQLIADYGRALGYVMLYGQDSASFPKDDAPRVVDVHSQKGKVLEVGIGRPRVLWVVYPWKGNDVLCRGAVLPYHEFTSSDRLTDAKWRELLDSSNAPDPPKWVKEWTVPKAIKER